MFEVGEKLVCVNDSPNVRTGATLPIREGEVYVVRKVISNPVLCREGYGVFLFGIFLGINPESGNEWHFLPSRFRKLSDMQAEASARHSKPENITPN